MYESKFEDGTIEIREGKLRVISSHFEDGKFAYTNMGIEGTVRIGQSLQGFPADEKESLSGETQEFYGAVPLELYGERIRLVQGRFGKGLTQVLSGLNNPNKFRISTMQVNYFSD
ncbi:MAG: hypothetical protein WDZ77_00040 [Candidatus Pacearchaeota archaeon]